MIRHVTIAVLACLPTLAVAETLTVPSVGSVAETVERLKVSVEEAGARVFTVIDFGGGIRSIGEDVGDLQLVIFGDPRIGAKALSADPMAALDLPAKVLVRGTEEGTEMSYEAPADMLAESGIPADAPVLKTMETTLERITRAAAE